MRNAKPATAFPKLDDLDAEQAGTERKAAGKTQAKAKPAKQGGFRLCSHFPM